MRFTTGACERMGNIHALPHALALWSLPLTQYRFAINGLHSLKALLGYSELSETFAPASRHQFALIRRGADPSLHSGREDRVRLFRVGTVQF